MFDAQSTNATADFLTHDGESWAMALEGVRVLYEPQGTSYVNQASGDVIQREERILAPLGVDQHAAEGDRVVLTYRNHVYQWRITNFRARSLDGVEGYCQMEFEDFGDSDLVDDGGGSGGGGDDWDIG